MKKRIAFLLALALALAMTVAASADTIQPKPIATDILHLENRMVRTDIEYKGGDIMTLTLYETERFDAEAIKAVKPGDVILTDGEEITIETIEEDGPDIYFNRGTAAEMLFCDAGFGEYEHVIENDEVPYIRIGTMEHEILEYFPILDMIDPITGEILEEYTVYRGDRLKELLQNPEAVGFNCRNVNVVYDRNNQIILMQRFYSPAQ